AAQAFAQEWFLAAEPDAQMPFDPDVTARNDERALIHADALGNRQARDVGVILHQSDRAGRRLRPAQPSAEPAGPLPRDGQVVTEDLARARVAALAVLLFHRDLGDAIGQLVRSNRQVVVLGPAVADERPWSRDPSDADAGNPVSLRQSTGDDHAIAQAPETPGARRRDFRAQIHLVRQQPRLRPFAARRNPPHRIVG